MGNFYHEWDLDHLPWDAVTPVAVGSKHPDVLDTKLVDAITNRALDESMHANARSACIAFLYLYMILACDSEKWVFSLPGRYV